jgi:hypothetical protein
MRLVFQHSASVYCWEIAGEFFVYGLMIGGDPRVCHSEAAARSIAAGAR